MELQIQSLLQEAEGIGGGGDGGGAGEGGGVPEDVKYLRKQYFLLNEDFQRPLRYFTITVLPNHNSLYRNYQDQDIRW